MISSSNGSCCFIFHRSVQSVMLPLRRMVAATTCTAVPAKQSSAGSVLDPGSHTGPAGELVGGVSILEVRTGTCAPFLQVPLQQVQ